MKAWLAPALFLAAALAPPAYAEFKDAAHPFVLWTKDDVAAAKKKIETQPWARERAAALPNNTFGRLFRYQVLGDEKAGKQERDYLLTFRKAPLNGISDSGGGSGLHTANYLNAIRYDVLYDTLTPQQRTELQDTFRKHIAEDITTWKTDPSRLGILPNLALPRRCGTLMMSVVLKDEKLIRELWAAPGSFKWYFNDYLSDGRFYNEEFGKMTSIIGEFLVYARGLDRLGLSELGFDFAGKTGGSLERYVHTYIELGYPRTTIPGGSPAYGRVTMGDAKGGQLIQHSIVPPFWPDGTGGWQEFYAANMNGRDHRGTKVEKLQTPQWFEILHARYPDRHYDYFLAQMRKPSSEFYTPTLFWGVDQVDPAKVKAPPAPSYVADERAFALLRANETPAYWESPDPAVALQLANFYVHYTNDCFSLLGYHAFNRPIYANRAISAGYNGGPWDMSVRGHAGVVVNQQMAQPIGQVPTRRNFAPLVKFVSARGVATVPLTGKGEARSSDQPREVVPCVYHNTDLSRTLFLTREYLFDVYQLAAVDDVNRDYWWLVHAPGSLVPEAGQNWQESGDLQKQLFSASWIKDGEAKGSRAPDPKAYHLVTEAADGPPWVVISNARKLASTEAPVSLNMLQDFNGQDVSQSRFGPAWYDRKIGVRVRMLGHAGTTPWVFDTPEGYAPGSPRTSDDKGHRARNAEWGGVSVAIHRNAASTVFAALHEPYEKGATPPTEFRAIQQTPEGLAVAITGTSARGNLVNDRLLLQFDRRPLEAVKAAPELEKDPAAMPLTLTDGHDSFTFTGHAFVRISDQKVEITGNVTGLKLKVSGTPTVVINGNAQTGASVTEGMVILK